MPECDLIYYREGDRVPVLEWLMTIPAKAQDKCIAYLAELEKQGHELRRPAADLLRDGIHELRPSFQGVHYRMLCFFSGRNVAVVSHGIMKESRVPAVEITRAIERKRRFEASPKEHTFRRPA